MTIFTCVSYAEARLSYRLNVCLSVRPTFRPSVCHTLVLCRNGSTYRQTVFTIWYPHDSSLLRSKLVPGIPMETPSTGALNARG